MQISFTEFKPEDKDKLVRFLTSERWEFHSTPQILAEKIDEQIKKGHYSSSDIKTFWICADGSKIGIIRLFDLGDELGSTETPLFDVRITNQMRGKGIGKQAVKWITEYVFTNYPSKNRFEANTRADNITMRRVLEHCGFVKEAHYRRAWPDENGNHYDCAGYRILRSDWVNKTKTPVDFNK